MVVVDVAPLQCGLFSGCIWYGVAILHCGELHRINVAVEAGEAAGGDPVAIAAARALDEFAWYRVRFEELACESREEAEDDRSDRETRAGSTGRTGSGD